VPTSHPVQVPAFTYRLHQHVGLTQELVIL